MMSPELEWQTRRDRINKKLRGLNPSWEIVKYSGKLDTRSLSRHAASELLKRIREEREKKAAKGEGRKGRFSGASE